MTLPRKYDLFDILDAIFYITETGCQWSMLPNDYPSWRAVYRHFRSWSDRGVSDTILKALVMGRRAGKGETPEPEVAVINSRSVRSGLPHSEKGIDGNKRIKGIKEHLAVDNNGYPLTLQTTTADVHDSKGACPLMANLISDWTRISTDKADKGYAGPLTLALSESSPISLELNASSQIPAHRNSYPSMGDGLWNEPSHGLRTIAEYADITRNSSRWSGTWLSPHVSA